MLMVREAKNVNVSIASGTTNAAYQKPIVSNTFYQFSESNTSTPATYSFPIPIATDLSGSSSWTYSMMQMATGLTGKWRFWVSRN